MKLLKKISAVIICVSCMTTTAYANNMIPRVYDFQKDSLYEYGFTTIQPHPVPENYIRTENGKLVFSGGLYDGNVYTTKEFDIPYVAGTISVEFDFNETENTMVSYQGFPKFVDSNDNKVSAISFSNNKLRTSGDYLRDIGTSYKYVELNIGQTYHFKILLNLDEKYYEIYIDGLQKCLYSNNECIVRFPYTAEDLKSIVFDMRTTVTKYQRTEISNLCITPADYSYIYVSGSGSDSNEGSKSAPLKTIDRAFEVYGRLTMNERANTVILLMSGEYEIPGDVNFGEINMLTEKHIPVCPMEYENIVLKGANTSIDELSRLNINERYKADILNVINSQHPDIFYQWKPEISAVSEASGTGIKIVSRGSRNYSAYSLDVSYDKHMAVTDKNISRVQIGAGSKNTILMANTETVFLKKLLLWDSLLSIKPLISSVEIGGEGND